MQKTIKLVALLLAMFCLLSVFAGCSGENQPANNEEETTAAANESTAEQTETETEFMPNVEKNDYNTEFYLSI